jgi:hypothetical protein
MHHRRIALLSVIFILLAFSALPAAAQPARAAESTAPGLRWIELWQSFIAPFTLQTDDGRAIWDPNGDDSTGSTTPTADGMTAPNGRLTS